MTSAAPEVVLAGTVALLRDRPLGMEVLMLRRARTLDFAADSWVFPGGRAEPADYQADRRPVDATAAHDGARRAAAREALEEAGVVVAPQSLVTMAHWTPPVGAPRRFSTWLFVGVAPTEDVVVDGGEITAHWWGRPADVLERHRARELVLLPPTWIALREFAEHRNVASVLGGIGNAAPTYFRPLIVEEEGIMRCLYAEDAEYPGQTEFGPTSRHRLTLDPSGWCYERAAHPAAMS